MDFVLVEKYCSSQHGVGQIWGILQKISEDSFTFDFEVEAISVQSRRSIHVLFYFIANTEVSLGPTLSLSEQYHITVSVFSLSEIFSVSETFSRLFALP